MQEADKKQFGHGQGNLFDGICSDLPDISDHIDSYPVGYLKFIGKRVEDGIIDAEVAAITLMGMNNSLRYIIRTINPELNNCNFKLPVKIKRGSWIIDLMYAAVVLVPSIGATAYLKKAAEKLAENDFKDASSKDIAKKALRALMYIVRISKHFKSNDQKRTFKNTQWENNNSEIRLVNDEGEFLCVPVEYLKLYASFPTNHLSLLAKNIEIERELAIGLYNDNATVDEVTIDHSEKNIFYEEPDDEIILPDLEHGLRVEIPGHVTRGNEKANTIGFNYNGHVITCEPISGNIIDYKPQLFRNCMIQGFVNRMGKDGQINRRRPRITFDALIIAESENYTPDMFNKLQAEEEK
jgi:hypothetical protein